MYDVHSQNVGNTINIKQKSLGGRKQNGFNTMMLL